VERVASVREPEHLLLTRPCDRCIEKAGDTDADRHADLAAVRAPRIIGRGRAGAHSDLTGSSGVMERASLRLARTRPCTSPVRRTPGTVESAEACRQPLAPIAILRGSLGETARDLPAAHRCRENQHSGPRAVSFRASPDLALCRECEIIPRRASCAPGPRFLVASVVAKMMPTERGRHC
jgi:hypothetical protein